MSDWKKDAADRRDARNIKSSDEPSKSSSRKDTRKWCGGREGREHVPACFAYGNDSWHKSWRTLSCTRCGKVLARYWPMNFMGLRSSEPKPDWVTF